MESGPLVPNNPIIREMQPANGDFGRSVGPRVYPELLSQESALGEYVRVLVKRKWTVLACLIIIFSLVAIASLKMTPVYEASGSIAINKPDSGLVNFSNSPTFSVDYYDPTEMETEVKNPAERSSGPAGHQRTRTGSAAGVRRKDGSSDVVVGSCSRSSSGRCRTHNFPALVLSRQFESSARSQHSYHRSSLQKSRQRPGRQRGQYPHDHLHGKQLQVPLRLHHAGLRLALEAAGGPADESGNLPGKTGALPERA